MHNNILAEKYSVEEALKKTEQILVEANEESDRRGELLEDLRDQTFKMRG